MEYIELKNISKTFYVDKQAIPALNDVTLKIKKGEIVSLMGRSGSGKSTIINIIAGLLRFEKGEFLFNGENITRLNNSERLTYRRNNIGMVVQNYSLLDDETVYNNVALPLQIRKFSKKEIKNLVTETLGTFGLKEKTNIPICKLSGGQKQRVAIARAMCYEPQVLLADEPTAALDHVSEQEIMDWFLKLNKNGTTIILVTHDKTIAQQGNRIITLLDGKIISEE